MNKDIHKELKNCPFCGYKAGTFINCDEKPMRYTVRCMNHGNVNAVDTDDKYVHKGCFFRPSLQKYSTINGYFEYFKTEEQAIRAWNRRA